MSDTKKETKAQARARKLAQEQQEAQAKAKKEVLKLLGGDKGLMQAIGVKARRSGGGWWAFQIIRGSKAHDITEQIATLLDRDMKWCDGTLGAEFGGDSRGRGYSDSFGYAKRALGNALFGNDYAFDGLQKDPKKEVPLPRKLECI